MSVHRMTTTTRPEFCARLLFTVYCRALGFKDENGTDLGTFDALEPAERAAWQAAATMLWDLATTGRAVLDGRLLGMPARVHEAP